VTVGTQVGLLVVGMRAGVAAILCAFAVAVQQLLHYLMDEVRP
jgi:hypothetical protein